MFVMTPCEPDPTPIAGASPESASDDPAPDTDAAMFLTALEAEHARVTKFLRECDELRWYNR